MIRAAWGSEQEWDGWAAYRAAAIAERWRNLHSPGANPAYDPQYALDLANKHLRLQLTYYSRGDCITTLSRQFPPLLEAWELSNQLADELCASRDISNCRDWTFSLSDLNHYNWCFWVVGLALALEIDDGQWHRLLALIGGAGEDVLLDRIIATRQQDRSVGSALLHARPYARLLRAIDAAPTHQGVLLHEFVDNWYVELERKGRKELWWYTYGDPVKHPLSMGSYFGRWSVEAVAAVKAFGLDDRMCLGHEHYPGDLLRPDGPSTHPARNASKAGWLSRLLGRKRT